MHPIKTFTLPQIEGISEKTMEIHLKLYAGYVSNLNAHYESLQTVREKHPDDMLTMSAITRRISFELAGVLNHERFFEVLEGGPAMSDGTFTNLVTRQFGSFDAFLTQVKKTALMMRGIGWVLVTYDKEHDILHLIWVSDHELGNVNLPAVLAIDMWEHAYFLDYAPANKGAYVDAYLQAIHWKTVEKIFATC